MISLDAGMQVFQKYQQLGGLSLPGRPLHVIPFSFLMFCDSLHDHYLIA